MCTSNRLHCFTWLPLDITTKNTAHAWTHVPHSRTHWYCHGAAFTWSFRFMFMRMLLVLQWQKESEAQWTMPLLKKKSHQQKWPSISVLECVTPPRSCNDSWVTATAGRYYSLATTLALTEGSHFITMGKALMDLLFSQYFSLIWTKKLFLLLLPKPWKLWQMNKRIVSCVSQWGLALQTLAARMF